MFTFKTFLCTTAATLTLLSVAGQQANAGQISGGWNYGIDSFNDGSGGSSYEIKGVAMKDTGDKIIVALTGGMPLAGTQYNASTHIGWGDLFFNFSGNNFQTASQNKQLFGVRFANYDNTLSTGVYKQVNAKSTTTSHAGYGSLKQYYDAGFDKTNSQGTDLATKQAVYNYYYPTAVAQSPTTSNTSILNAINSGTKVGSVSMLTASTLNSTYGLNFGNFSALGTETFGFSFDKALIGTGNFISNIYLECGNDGVALKGNIKTTPEPNTTAGLFVLGLVFSMTQLQKYRKTALS